MASTTIDFDRVSACVAEWFPAWVGYHQEVCPRSDWESLEAAPYFWANVRKQFVRGGLHDMLVAVAASDRVSILRLREKGDHAPELLAAAAEIYRERREQTDGQPKPASLEEAKAMSAGCLDCGGQTGFATRYRHNPENPGYDLLYCLCPYGKAIRDNHASKSPEIRKRHRDLADYPFLHRDIVPWSDQIDNKHCYPPSSWDAANGRPIPTTLDDLKALTRGAKGVTTSLRDALREPEKPRTPYTLNQRQFLGSLGSLREAFDGLAGDERGAILACFADDARPYDHDLADRETRRVSHLADLATVAAARARDEATAAATETEPEPVGPAEPAPQTAEA